MSNNDINLLSNINKNLEKQEKLAKTLKILCIACLVFVGMSAIVVFVLNSQFSVSSITSQQETVLQKIQALHQKEAKLFVIKNRLKNISDILAKKTDYYKISTSLLQKIPAEVSINKLAIDGKKISLTASSDSLLSINNLLSNLMDMAKKKELSSLILDSLSLNEKLLRYSISLEAVL